MLVNAVSKSAPVQRTASGASSLWNRDESIHDLCAYQRTYMLFQDRVGEDSWNNARVRDTCANLERRAS
jgi:hypothetical protein